MNRHLIVAKAISFDITKKVAEITVMLIFSSIMIALSLVFPLPIIAYYLFFILYKIIYSATFIFNYSEPDSPSIVFGIIILTSVMINIFIYADLLSNEKYKRIYRRTKRRIEKYYEEADEKIATKLLSNAQAGDISVAENKESKGGLEEL